VNADKIKYMVMSRVRNAGRSQNIKTDNNSFERMEEFKHMGTISTNPTSILGEIKIRMKSGNACYHSVQNFLYSV